MRQEECIDMSSREVNHEREVCAQLQISQSWEDLTLDAENWSFKSDNSSDLTNPLHVTLPTGISCSSPSPTRFDNNKQASFFLLLLIEITTTKLFRFNFSFEIIVAEPDYDSHHMVYHHHQHVEHFKHDVQCHRSQCDPVRWARLSVNSS